MNFDAAVPPLLPPPSPLRIERVGFEGLEVLRHLNRTIFSEERVINTFDREGLMMLLAYAGDATCGFKIGYRENRHTFYSAKGGVLPTFRRHGVARRLLLVMLDLVKAEGYQTFAFDTFPNRHPGMSVMALTEGFRLVRADFNTTYHDYRLRFEKRL